MKLLDIKQSTPEWIEARKQYFTASEAPAMMCDSKYQSRKAYLIEKATGVRAAVTPRQQAIFDQGHAAEAAARPIIERLIGEELYPVVGVKDNLLASFDGLTLDNRVVFEHKLFNKSLVEQIRADINQGLQLEPHYYWQLEQQLYVADAEKAVFVCSDGTEDNMAICWYNSQPGRREALLGGWKQFEQELDEYRAGIQSGKIKPEQEAVVRDEDEDFQNAEADYLNALSDFESAKENLEQERQKLINLTDGVKTKGAYVQLSPVHKAGSINWQKAFNAFCPSVGKGELDQFRGKPSDSWLIKEI